MDMTKQPWWIGLQMEWIPSIQSSREQAEASTVSTVLAGHSQRRVIWMEKN
jgi:hypothetical protein